MSIPLWDEGNVLACVCVAHCDRCDARNRCVQIFCLQPRTHINLCFECWSDLSLCVSEYCVSKLEENS